MASKDVLSPERLEDALAVLHDWRYREGALVTAYTRPRAAAALELMAAGARLAEEQNHHPDLDWRYNRVFLRYTSHDAGGEVTARDVGAAEAVREAAAALRAVAEPERHPAGA